jgi:hypothetical protein
VLDIEGNQREIIDAFDRVVMRYDYDILRTKIHQASRSAPGTAANMSSAPNMTRCAARSNPSCKAATRPSRERRFAKFQEERAAEDERAEQLNASMSARSTGEPQRSENKLPGADVHRQLMGQLEETGKTGNLRLFKDLVEDVASIAASNKAIDVGVTGAGAVLGTLAKTAGDTIRSSVGRRYTVYFVYGEAVAKSVTYIGITKDFIQRLAQQYKKADRELHPIFFSNLDASINATILRG